MDSIWNGTYPKSLRVVLNITEGMGGRLNLFQKFWGSLEVVLMHFLGCFEIVLSGMFFLNRLISKLSHGCPIRVEGQGSRPFLGNV